MRTTTGNDNDRRRDEEERRKKAHDLREKEYVLADFQSEEQGLKLKYAKLEAEIREKERNMSQIKAEVEHDRKELAMLGQKIDDLHIDEKKVTGDITKLRYQH
jgi:chromosome segregation ATPase